MACSAASPVAPGRSVAAWWQQVVRWVWMNLLVRDTPQAEGAGQVGPDVVIAKSVILLVAAVVTTRSHIDRAEMEEPIVLDPVHLVSAQFLTIDPRVKDLRPCKRAIRALPPAALLTMHVPLIRMFKAHRTNIEQI